MKISGSLKLTAIVCAVTVPLCPLAQARYGGGSGTEGDPYRIAAAADLILLGETPTDYDKHFMVTADIDLDPNLPGRKVFDTAVIAPVIVDPNPGGSLVRDFLVMDPDPNSADSWFPGTSFTGVFDGRGHAISHLTIAGGKHLGLFGKVGSAASISNLGLEAVDVDATGDYVGALVGFNCGTISTSYSTGVVRGDDYVGGLVGENLGRVATNYSACTVSGDYYVGVLVGNNWVGTVSGSNAAGSVSGHWLVGGLVGMNKNGTITASYSISTVTGGRDAGGLVGHNYDDGRIDGSYSAGAVSGYTRVGGLVGGNGGGIIATSYSAAIVDGVEQIGALVGFNCGNISTSYSTGTATGNTCIGGLVGKQDKGGRVRYCYSAAPASGNESIGGLVGANWGVIAHSYSLGDVGGGRLVGGLVGCHGNAAGDEGGANPPEILDCYSVGTVSGDSGLGGLVAHSCSPRMPARRVFNCFWDTETSGQADSSGGTGLTTARMQDRSTFMAAGWDFLGQPDGPHDIWVEPEGGGYPVLWWQVPSDMGLPVFSGGTGSRDDPYLIATAEELSSIGHNPRLMQRHFKVVEDLDMSGVCFHPIGGWHGSYAGVFDGDGHVISNLTVEGEGYLGLLGALAPGAKVKDVGVVDVNVTGSADYVGGLVGYNQGHVTRCYTTGCVRGADAYVGGLIGYHCRHRARDTVVSDCYSAAEATARRVVGGLVGYSLYGRIVACYSTGPVVGEESIGGLVGGRYYGSVGASFWDIQTSRLLTSYGGIGKTTADMQTAHTFLNAGWDFVGETANGTDDIWWIEEGKDYPRLWWEIGDETPP